MAFARQGFEMKYLFILTFFILGTLTSSAQKEPKSRVSNRSDNVKVKEVTLTKAQQDWLNINYQQLARLRKDAATAVARKQFSSADEATLEFLISVAGRMANGDNQNQIVSLQQQIEELKAQQRTLLSKIKQKEEELERTNDAVKKEKLKQEILQLKKQVALMNIAIEDKEKAIRRLQVGQ